MKSGRFGCAFAILLGCALLPVAQAGTLKKLELTAPSSDSAHLVIDLTAMPARKVFAVDKAGGKPDRIVIDLVGTKLGAGVKMPRPVGPVTSIRSGAPAASTLRLVVELKRKLNPVVSVKGSRLTVDMGSASKSAAPAPESATATSTVAAAQPAVAPASSVVRAQHAPQNTGRDCIVAVDAGHGGTDPGASGARGTHEKDVVLAIARALARRIDKEPGMRAYLTRNSDQKIELRDRIRLASKAGADIFVSVHADSYKDSDVAGSSVYILSERGASSEAARLLAEHENAVDQDVGTSGDDKALNSVLLDVSQTASMEKSMDAAEHVLSQLDGVGTIRKTKVQQAGFAVLKLPNIPSMLVETAYITNPGEEKKLADPAHQAQLAEAIFNGVREFLRSRPPPGTAFDQQRHAEVR